jgi:ribosomal protein S18 acetylase RimI-like enzyme
MSAIIKKNKSNDSLISEYMNSISATCENARQTNKKAVKVDDENKVVGVLKFSLSAVDSVLEISMDVLCSVRKGVGKELIDIMKAFVRQEVTIKSIYLMPDNDGLVSYYESRGFRGDERSMMWEPSYEGGRRKPKTKRRRRLRKTYKKRIGRFF